MLADHATDAYVRAMADDPRGFTSSVWDRVVASGWPALLVPVDQGGLGLGLVQMLVAVAVLALWRARRLGRVVEEPLPVVVKAIETTQRRGRLDRKARDRQHAAAALRTRVPALPGSEI